MSKPAGVVRDGAAALPSIPAKRYFTIGEVSDLCLVKPHVLRYWEQEFTQLKPIKRRGNRRYYQHHEVLLIRRIRELLYEQGFTINGARNRLDGSPGVVPRRRSSATVIEVPDEGRESAPAIGSDGIAPAAARGMAIDGELGALRAELEGIRALFGAARSGKKSDDTSGR